jgi:FAD/FMN-containing dehydrogenase
VASVITILTSEATSDLPACPFAVKSGGHTPFAGANNIDGGIVLDLSRLDSTHLSADQKIVGIGPGSTWQAAANKLDGTGIGIPTGRCPSTAVGGVTLGGGISFFAPKIGFAADNVLNYEVVLASGAIVNANARISGLDSKAVVAISALSLVSTSPPSLSRAYGLQASLCLPMKRAPTLRSRL